MTQNAPEIAAFEACLAAVPDMAALSARVFARFLDEFPDEAARFINLDAAVLRMTDETFVLLHGIATGAGWAAVSAAHWADLHRNYGPITNARYCRWVALCVAELAAVGAADWPLAEAAVAASAAELCAVLARANG